MSTSSASARCAKAAQRSWPTPVIARPNETIAASILAPGPSPSIATALRSSALSLPPMP